MQEISRSMVAGVEKYCEIFVMDAESRLWNRPFMAGLPDEFAPAVLDGLLADGVRWPAGTLRVDRAGFDEIGSSSVVFAQTAAALARALSASLRGADVEAELRALLLTW